MYVCIYFDIADTIMAFLPIDQANAIIPKSWITLLIYKVQTKFNLSGFKCFCHFYAFFVDIVAEVSG